MNHSTDKLLCNYYKNSTNNFLNSMNSESNNNMESEVLKIIFTCYWTLAMITSLIGNASTCAVICRDRALRTSTNCYLFHLALIDLMITLLVPNEIYLLWTEKLYPFRFNLTLSLVLYYLTNLSVLTITSLTIERYLVITKPFLRPKLASKYRVLKIITCIWIGTSCYHAVVLMKVLSSKSLYDFCNIKISAFENVRGVIDMLLFFLIPLFIILILYVFIVIKMKSMKSNVVNSVSSINNDKAVTVLGAVAGIFFFCWSPSFAFRAILFWTPPITAIKHFYIFRKLHYLCSIAVYTSGAVNPVLYYTMSTKFRKAYKDLLGNCFRTESAGQANETEEK